MLTLKIIVNCVYYQYIKGDMGSYQVEGWSDTP